MNRIIVLIKSDDYKVFKSSINEEELKTIDVYTFSVEAMERAIDLGCSKINLMHSNSFIQDAPRIAHIESDRIARTFDNESAKLRNIYYNDDNHYHGWDYLNIYYLNHTIIRSNLLAQELVKNLPDSKELMIVWNENVQDYYFDSVITRSIIAKNLQKKFSKITGFKSSSNNPYRINAYDKKILIPDGTYDTLVHLPTAFYSAQEHFERLKNKNYLDVQSPYFDIKFSNNRATLTAEYNFTDEKYDSYKIAFVEIYKNFFLKHEIPKSFEQIVRQLQRSIFQMECYEELRNSQTLNSVSKIELTDHDAGLQGPIFSFSQYRNIELNYWPHSSVTIMPILSGNKGKITRNNVLNGTSSYPVIGFEGCVNNLLLDRKVNHKKNLRKVTIFHNEIDDPSGLQLIDTKQFLIDYKKLIELLEARKIEIRSREKPSHSYKTYIPKIVPNQTGKIQEFIDWPDLCISIGTPTSAILDFWRRGTQCLHLTYYSLTEPDLETLPNDVMVIKLFEDNAFNKILEFIESNFINH